jgi:hypothetical protein
VSIDKYKAWWEIQDYIKPYVHNDWHRIDEIIGNVGLAAVKNDPIGYLINTFNMFISIHNADKSPWWFNLTFFGDKSYYATNSLNCRTYNTFVFCQPIIFTPYSYQVWDQFVSVSSWLYIQIFTPICLYVFLPALVLLFISSKMSDWVLGLLYIIPLMFSALSITPEPRYLMPSYPLILLITLLGFKKILKIGFVIKNKLFNSNGISTSR